MWILTVLFPLLLSAAPGKNLPVTPARSGAVNKEVLLQLVNQMRQSGCNCGGVYYGPVKPVSWNNDLEKAALNHSQDMLDKKYFSHKNKEGANAGDRMDAIGYNWKAFGENIAFGYKNEREVVEGWLKSPGHCKNIMNGSYKEMAVAKAGGYWTQVFGAR